MWMNSLAIEFEQKFIVFMNKKNISFSNSLFDTIWMWYPEF